MHTTIIGAGPIGSYTGYLLSKRGISNAIIEEHSKIGKPEQCTGLISRNIETLIKPQLCKKAVLNKVYGAVIRCGKARFEVKTSNFKAYVFDRLKFDKIIADQAKNKGSRLLLNHRYISHSPTENGLRIGLKSAQKAGRKTKNKVKYLNSNFLIGADGPVSKVAKNSSLYGDRKFFIGMQSIIRSKKPMDLDKNLVYLYIDKKYSDGFFAWIVPIDESRAKVGLASFTNPAGYFKRFLKDKLGSQGKNYSIIERHAGLIPLYIKIPLQNKQKNIFLVGDAALQCKATTGGGIVNGMEAANALANSIAEGDRDYEAKLGKIRRNLWLHSLIRKKANRMDDKAKQDLLKDLNDEKIKQVLREKGDMDFVAGFALKIVAAKPSLLRYII